jgi:hypothetical protein
MDADTGDFEVASDAPAVDTAASVDAPKGPTQHAITDNDFEDRDESPAPAKAETADALAKRKNSREKRVESFQEKINRLRWESGEEERKLEALRAEVAKAKPEKAESPAPKKFAAMPDANPDDPKPSSSDFDDYEDFIDERAGWMARRYIDQEKRQARDAHQRTLAEHAKVERRTRFTERLDAARQAHADFDARTDKDTPLTPPMQDVVVDSEIPGDLLLYLADHEDEAERIRQMPNPIAQFGEMKKIEARLETRLQDAPSGPSKATTLSSAKRPIKPVGTTHGAATEADDEDLDVDAHISKYNRLDHQRRRA